MISPCTSAFSWSLLASLVLTVIAVLLGRRVLDRIAPGSRYDLTGLVIIGSIALAAKSADVVDLPAIDWVLILSAAVLALGIFFDEQPSPWYWRAAALLAIGVAQAFAGVRIEALKVPFSIDSAPVGIAGTLVTALWLALLAGLFGRSGTIGAVPSGVGLLAGLTFCAVGAIRPDLANPSGTLLGAVVAGACLPILLLSRSLQRGGATSGGYVIGYLLAVASILGALKNTAFLVAAVPLLIVGAPLFAAFCLDIGQLRPGHGAITLERRLRHLHEVLIAQGYTPGQVLRIILAGTAYLCAVALLLVYLVELHFLLKLLLLLILAPGGLMVFYVVLRMMGRPGVFQATDEPAPVHILGVKLHPVTMDKALATAERFIREDRPHMVVTADASGVIRAVDDPQFREIVNAADLVTPDGAGVVLSARLLNIPLIARCAGCDMVQGLCQVAAKLGRSVFLLGAGPGVAELAGQKLQERVPGLEIAGVQDGYFKPEDEPEIIARIQAARPAVLFVALGIPRQEIWIRAHLEELGVPVCVGVGGSFDVISGLKQRAPVWMQRAGVEWLYRVAKEPWRLPRLAALPRIVWLTFLELLRAPRATEEP
ncbi:MAG: WecB/TagA/CpsF family glycosyltransferase [Acidobacteriota bacterium]|nr:WecB/TagA/CpsF family glycosyltransferase [Acidobacteriota bacterium]